MPKPWRPDETVDVEISSCGFYRYSLKVRWKPGKTLVDRCAQSLDRSKRLDDKTVRACIKWARRRDYGAVTMLNTYPFHDTKPEKMKDAADLPLAGQHGVVIRRACMSSQPNQRRVSVSTRVLTTYQTGFSSIPRRNWIHSLKRRRGSSQLVVMPRADLRAVERSGDRRVSQGALQLFGPPQLMGRAFGMEYRRLPRGGNSVTGDKTMVASTTRPEVSNATGSMTRLRTPIPASRARIRINLMYMCPRL